MAGGLAGGPLEGCPPALAAKHSARSLHRRARPGAPRTCTFSCGMMRAASSMAANRPSTSSMDGFSSTSRSAGRSPCGRAGRAQPKQGAASGQSAGALLCARRTQRADAHQARSIKSRSQACTLAGRQSREPPPAAPAPAPRLTNVQLGEHAPQLGRSGLHQGQVEPEHQLRLPHGQQAGVGPWEHELQLQQAACRAGASAPQQSGLRLRRAA